jgi:cell shape-determining protein MreC
MISYGKVIKAVFAAIFLGLLLFLSNTGFILSLEEKVLNIFNPILFAASDLKQTISAGNAQESLENLRRESERAEIEHLTLENNSLRKALRFSEERQRLEGRRVISYRMEFGKEFLFIERGIKEGVKDGDIVVDSLGFLVGVVKEATEAGSHVEVISNPGQTLEVLILPFQIRALAKGIGG